MRSKRSCGGAVVSRQRTPSAAVIERALQVLAPFHRRKNSVADALLIEMYHTAVSLADLTIDPHTLVYDELERLLGSFRGQTTSAPGPFRTVLR